MFRVAELGCRCCGITALLQVEVVWSLLLVKL
jgi:hypothetical protein